MKNKIRRIIIWILSRSPLLSLTLDSNFHQYDWKRELSTKDLRFSFLSFGLGVWKIYFFTYSKESKFKLFKIIKQNDIISFPLDKDVELKKQKYRMHLLLLRKNAVQIEADFIKYKISDSEKTINIATNKMNAYTAILLVLIPLIIANGLKIFLTFNNKIALLIAISFLYCLVNIIIIVFSFFKVKSHSRSQFSDLKASTNPLIDSTCLYYEDMYCASMESPVFVTYVANVERYVKMAVIFIFLFIIFNSINFGLFSLTPTNNLSISHLNTNVICVENNGEILVEDLNKIQFVENEIINKQIKKIIILAQEPKNQYVKEKYKSIIDSIKLYSSNACEFYEVTDTDNIDNSSNKLKIILIGE